MHDIKTRQTRKDIKKLDKTADLSRHLQNATIHTKEQTESPEHGDYVGEARDKVQDTAKTAGNATIRAVGRAGKEAVRRIRAGHSSTEGPETDAGTGESGSGAHKTGEARGTASGTGPEKGAGAAKDAAVKMKQQPVPQREPAAFNVAAPMEEKTAENFNRTLPSFSQQVRSAEKTGKGTIKTMPRTIKTAGQTAGRAAKTTGQAAKGAVKAAQRTAQAARKARQAAKAAKASARVTVKVAKLTVKAAAAIVRGLLALAGIGGPGLVLVVIVIAAAALIASPFGILFSGDNTDSGVQSVSGVVQQVDTEFNQKISEIEQSNPHDSVNIQYVGSADNTRVDNWLDVLAVFAVKTATNSQDAMDVATLDTTRVGLLKDVFWDMNRIDYHVDMADQASSSSASGTASGTGNSSSSASSQATGQRVLTITVTSKTADQQADDYGFTADQKSMVDQLLSSDFRTMLLDLLGKGGGDGLTSGQLQDIENNLPESGVGSDVVKLALSQLGDPYSQILAGQGNYTDCSYLVQSCYKQVGIDLPRTAADQAQYCVEHNLTISKDNLEPGDLVFWSFEENGRYMDITHVGIYAGNGKVIDASSSHDAVMYRDLYYADQQVLYSRPGV